MTAGLALDKADLANMDRDGETWEKVARKLRNHEMPPAGLPRPDDQTAKGLSDWLEGALDATALARPNPGRPSLHRLNRAEYGNAIRDLLALDVNVSTLLPADDSTHGFDNIADVLGVSPLLLEDYIGAGRQISRLAVGDPAIAPVATIYRAPHDETQDYPLEGMPLGTRGGLLVHSNFPLTGEYEIRVKLAQSQLMQIRGLQEPHQLEIAIDGARAKLFDIEGGPQMYAAKFYDAPTPSQTADASLHFRISVNAGPHVVTAAFPMRSAALSETMTPPTLRSYPGANDVVGLPHIDQLIVTGPYKAVGVGDTPSRRAIFSCRPAKAVDELPCAKQILSTIGRRAYRGQFADADLDRLLKFYTEGRKSDGFEAGIEMALWRMLASPQFVFRAEFDPQGLAPGAPYRVGDLELASRLSFFLWSSIPDDQLLDLASHGRLKDDAVLEQQVRRMLADPRSSALVDNFAGQWLYLRNLDSANPNITLFRNFDDNLRHAFRRETEMLFEYILRENRSTLEFLTADYTFVDERLARHYGIPNVKGSQFRKVAITDDNRRGLLGQGSILTITSYGNRTSPVQRGKWVLENILGSPPPPPPPNVPELKDARRDGKVLTIREQMAEHRANPVCASCHARMDPIGFALENFDAVGSFRKLDAQGQPIDPSGVLPDGTRFDGPKGLRAVLVSDPERFVQTTTEKLLMYALGRSIDYYDQPAIRTIVRKAAASNYTMSSLILGVARSLPFQMSRTEEADVVKRAVGADR